ncbi:MAG: helix-turn-helix transcriptional regulator [Sphingobium sp.]
MSERLLNRVRQEREARGWTQAALAERIGVSRKTVNTIENLVFSPSALLALKFAEAFDSRVEAIFWIDRS